MHAAPTEVQSLELNDTIAQGVERLRIGIDLMGGDSSPAHLYDAVEHAVGCYPEIDFTVFATQSALDEVLKHRSISPSQSPSSLEFQIISDVISMDDDPIESIRRKKNSSLVVGFKLLKKRYLDGFVSVGNTGALIAGATLLLPLLPGIKRPALLATLPTEKGAVSIIDVGGNVSCKASHLVQFAQMGVAYQQCCRGVEKPRVGLLNIGIESRKGTAEVRQAYELLQELSVNAGLEFVGNVEGGEVFRGAADVIVTNGFSGNILLKVSEGVSSFILHKLEKAVKAAVPEQGELILGRLQRQFDYEEYSGAIVCGVDCVVVKCHGGTSAKGFLNGIKGAIRLVQNNFVNEMRRIL